MSNLIATVRNIFSRKTRLPLYTLDQLTEFQDVERRAMRRISEAEAALAELDHSNLSDEEKAAEIAYNRQQIETETKVLGSARKTIASIPH